MRRDQKIVGALLGAVAAWILFASSMCSLAIAAGASPKWALLFRFLCHGMPQRSFELFATPMPICARCTGIYAGFLLGVLLFALLPDWQERRLKTAMLMAVLPLAVDGVTQALGWRESFNALRVSTGMLAAALFAMWCLRVIGNEEQRAVAAP